jgi:hypothetical protein
MDEEILDVKGAARARGVSTRTIYSLARKGENPAMRVGCEWHFARRNLVDGVANGSQVDPLSAVLRHSRIARKRA